jgi:uncharacterized ferritin-like protein (DUF455 family)
MGPMVARPGRDVSILEQRQMSPRKGLALKEGQARLLHDLGNIELQAMELAARTLYEFPEAPPEFRNELVEIALEEATHFELCLNALDELAIPWGTWPVHCSLWEAVGKYQNRADLLGRIMLVHRYMEGSGLDAGARILERLSGVNGRTEGPRGQLTGNGILLTRKVVHRIVEDEIGHVSFGSRWYHAVCERNRIDANEHFKKSYPEILWLLPRTERPAYDLRRQAGFSEYELDVIGRALEMTDFSTERPAERPKLDL